jgi:hypothetical protein
MSLQAASNVYGMTFETMYTKFIEKRNLVFERLSTCAIKTISQHVVCIGGAKDMSDRFCYLPSNIVSQAHEVRNALTNYSVYSTVYNRDRALKQISQLVGMLSKAISKIDEREQELIQWGVRKQEDAMKGQHG